MCGDGVLGRGGRDGSAAAAAPAIRPHQELEGAGSRLSSGSGRTGSASGLRMVRGPPCSFPSQLLLLCDSGPGTLMAWQRSYYAGSAPSASHASAHGGPFLWSRGKEARRATHGRRATHEADAQGPRPRLPAALAPLSSPAPRGGQGLRSPRGSPRLSRPHSPSGAHLLTRPRACCHGPLGGGGHCRGGFQTGALLLGAPGECSAPRKGPSSARHLPAATQPVPGGGS